MDRRTFLAPGQKVQSASASQTSGLQWASGLQPYTGPWTNDEVCHLLKRVLFGASHGDIAYFLSKSPSAAVDEMLNPTAPMPDPPLKNYANTNTPTTDLDLTVPAGQTWVNTRTVDGTVEGNRRNSLRNWWMGVILNQDRSLREKMTLFWHNHFATEVNDVGNSIYMYKHVKLMRDNALGNVKTLVRAMSVDPAMLVYLNGQLNTKTAPDENYSRELQELFTLGKENNPNYIEDDVKAAARVLTGWRNDSTKNASYFDSTRHDTTDKTFSSFYGNRVIKGRTGATAGDMELDELIDMIFSKTVEVSRYIVTRLYRWFVYYEIDAQTQANVIDPLAQLLVSSNWEIKPVLARLFKSRHFFDPLAHGCQIKSPIDMVASLWREFGVGLPAGTDYGALYVHWNYVRNWAFQMQQGLADPPDVSGWKAYYQTPNFYGIWLNSDTYPKRIQFSDIMVGNGYTASNRKIVIDHVAYAKRFPNPGDPNVLIADIVAHLFQLPLSLNSRNQLKKDILLSGQDQDYYWTNAWTAHIANPADAAALRVVQTRLQTLLKYLMNLPEYQLA